MMDRNAWKAAFGTARAKARKGKPNGVLAPCAIDTPYGAVIISDSGFVGQHGADNRRLVAPSIIRDRSPLQRIACELAFARIYRRDASRVRYAPNLVESHKLGARKCLADARAIRESASIFHALP